MKDKIIDVLPEKEQRRERILHAVKRLANAVDELIKEVIRDDGQDQV